MAKDIFALLPELKLLIDRRIEEYGITPDEITDQMREDGIIMDKKRVQRFLIHGKNKPLPQRAILWIALRLGIKVSIGVSLIELPDETRRSFAKTFSAKYDEERNDRREESDEME